MNQKTNIKDIIVTIFLITLIILGGLSYFINPIGVLPLGDYSISSITITMFLVSVLILWLYYNHISSLPRFICAITIPVLGMSFNELFWHIGCYLTWGTGNLNFWILYTIIIGLGIFLLNEKYSIIEFRGLKRYLLVISLILYVMGYYLNYDKYFYLKLLMFDYGLKENPHTMFHYATATCGRMMWLILVRKEKNVVLL